MGAAEAAHRSPGAAVEGLPLRSQAEAGGAQQPGDAALCCGQGLQPGMRSRKVRDLRQLLR